MVLSKSVVVHRFIALEFWGQLHQVNILGLPPSMLSLMEPTDLIDTRTKWHCFLPRIRRGGLYSYSVCKHNSARSLCLTGSCIKKPWLGSTAKSQNVKEVTKPSLQIMQPTSSLRSQGGYCHVRLVLSNLVFSSFQWPFKQWTPQVDWSLGVNRVQQWGAPGGPVLIVSTSVDPVSASGYLRDLGSFQMALAVSWHPDLHRVP